MEKALSAGICPGLSGPQSGRISVGQWENTVFRAVKRTGKGQCKAGSLFR